jgi:hypothetical protein
VWAVWALGTFFDADVSPRCVCFCACLYWVVCPPRVLLFVSAECGVECVTGNGNLDRIESDRMRGVSD